jgi:hypothetical protein
VPYPQIRRQGVVERRRRVAVAGAVLVTLAAVPVGAFALDGRGTGVADTATTPTASASATRAPTSTPSPTPSGPAGPATAGQLRDGITLEQAVDGLGKCLAWQRHNEAQGSGKMNLGTADDYRIILALDSTGDLNSPGDGVFVVAVKEKATQVRLVCNVKGGVGSGLNTVIGNERQPDSPPVMVDVNANKLYQQSFMNKGRWKLPFSWGFIGSVDPTVAKVTVSYGGVVSQAVLDHGWFVASGTLTEQVTKNPHVKGYDKVGKLIYDSDEDTTYQQTM